MSSSDPMPPGRRASRGPCGRPCTGGSSLARASMSRPCSRSGTGGDEDERDRREDGNGPGEGLVHAARTGGALTWTRDGERIEAPALPEHRFVSCYTLHLEDLLAGDADTDADIARRLVREMAGGYDLDAARRECGFSVPPRAGQTEANEVSSAESDLRRRQARYQELQRDEERLGPLERELDEAREAEREAALAEQALRLLEKRREGSGSSGAWRRFPRDMERLSGDEAEALERLDGERRRAEQDLARAEADRRAAERTLAATGLAGSPLDEGQAADMRPRIARLELLEGELARVRDRAEEEAAARDRAARELGGEPGEGVRLGPEAVHAADQALDAIRQIAAELRELDAELNRLADVPETEPDPERVDEARRELLHWLSAPDVSGTPAFARGRHCWCSRRPASRGPSAAGYFLPSRRVRAPRSRRGRARSRLPPLSPRRNRSRPAPRGGATIPPERLRAAGDLGARAGRRTAPCARPRARRRPPAGGGPPPPPGGGTQARDPSRRVGTRSRSTRGDRAPGELRPRGARCLVRPLAAADRRLRPLRPRARREPGPARDPRTRIRVPAGRHRLVPGRPRGGPRVRSPGGRCTTRPRCDRGRAACRRSVHHRIDRYRGDRGQDAGRGPARPRGAAGGGAPASPGTAGRPDPGARRRRA